MESRYSSSFTNGLDLPVSAIGDLHLTLSERREAVLGSRHAALLRRTYMISVCTIFYLFLDHQMLRAAQGSSSATFRLHPNVAIREIGVYGHTTASRVDTGSGLSRTACFA